MLKSGRTTPTPDADYYKVLAQRLETLLGDMERAGMPSDEDLTRRLQSLLDEARRYIGG